MSIKRKVLATVATLTLAGGAVAASALTAGTARAATPPCGRFCVNTQNAQVGKGFYIDVYRQGNRVNQPIIMFRGSNEDPALDWSIDDLLNPATFTPYNVKQLAGIGAPIPATTVAVYGNSPAVELEYSPYGVNSGLCMGLLKAPVNGEGVTLQPCGITATTVWIVACGIRPGKTINVGTPTPNPTTGAPTYPVTYSCSQPLQGFRHGWSALINGANANFSHQYALTYPNNGFPTDLPRPQLYVHTVQSFSTGRPFVYTNQLWKASFGVLSGG